jgi:hypothetical protein
MFICVSYLITFIWSLLCKNGSVSTVEWTHDHTGQEYFFLSILYSHCDCYHAHIEVTFTCDRWTLSVLTVCQNIKTFSQIYDLLLIFLCWKTKPTPYTITCSGINFSKPQFHVNSIYKFSFFLTENCFHYSNRLVNAVYYENRMKCINTLYRKCSRVFFLMLKQLVPLCIQELKYLNSCSCFACFSGSGCRPLRNG